MTGARILDLGRVVLAGAAGALVVGGLVAATGQLDIDTAMATVIALTMAVAGIGTVGGFLLSRRGEPGVGCLLQGLGVATTAGVIRHLDLGSTALVVTGMAWLVAPVIGLGAVVAAARTHATPSRPGRAGAGSVATTRAWSGATVGALAVAVGAAVGAAVTGAGAGPGTATVATVATTVPPLARWLLGVHTVALGVAFVLGGAIPSPAARHRPDPLGWAGAGFAVATLVSLVIHLLPGRLIFAADGYRAWPETMGLKVPVTATAALMLVVIHRAVVGPWLRPTPDRVVLPAHRLATLGDDLATWTGDPSVSVAFASGDGWVDRDGRQVADPGTDPERISLVLQQGGEPVARVDHDRELASQPGVIDFDTGLVGALLAIERDTALTAARLHQARLANTRLLRADDEARHALLDELLAGPVVRLRSLAADTRRGADLAAVSDGIRAVAGEVRELSHGLHPPELVAGGLGAALGAVPGVPARRLPPAVEVTAYLAAQDRPGAVFDDRGSSLGIRVPGPVAGLPVERIEALGGSVRLSANGVEMALPTGWE